MIIKQFLDLLGILMTLYEFINMFLNHDKSIIFWVTFDLLRSVPTSFFSFKEWYKPSPNQMWFCYLNTTLFHLYKHELLLKNIAHNTLRLNIKHTLNYRVFNSLMECTNNYDKYSKLKLIFDKFWNFTGKNEVVLDIYKNQDSHLKS